MMGVRRCQCETLGVVERIGDDFDQIQDCKKKILLGFGAHVNQIVVLEKTVRDCKKMGFGVNSHLIRCSLSR